LKINQVPFLLALLLGLLLPAFDARSFYDPSQGRWVNRDPLGAEVSTIDVLATPDLQEPGGFMSDFPLLPFEAWGGANLYGFIENNPNSFVDPFGLTSIHAQVAVAAARGDVLALQSLLATGQLNAAQTALAQATINKYRSTAIQWITRNCRGGIGREFPSQFYNQTLEQIRRAAQSGDRAARKAWKLLNDKRFEK
jgi:hypothetical protein